MTNLNYEDVKQVRKQARLTQKAMSELFKIPYRTISDWERGLRNPPEWVCLLLVNPISNGLNR